MTINSRIEKIKIHYFGENRGNHKKFIDKLGISSNTASNWMKDGYSIGRGVINQITDAFPEINANWLLTGEGAMLKEGLTQESITIQNTEGVPYFEDIESTGGIVVGKAGQGSEIPSFYINYEHFNDCTAYIQHVGDSMYPKYCSGEIIALKRVFNFNIILWGEAYLIVTNSNANDLRTVKLLFPDEDPSKLILRSSNPNFKGDTPVNKKDIISLFLVKGKITRNQL